MGDSIEFVTLILSKYLPKLTLNKHLIHVKSHKMLHLLLSYMNC